MSPSHHGVRRMEEISSADRLESHGGQSQPACEEDEEDEEAEDVSAGPSLHQGPVVVCLSIELATTENISD